jgi:hypothetical protein
MIRRFFRRADAEPPDAAWWRAAEALAEAPTAVELERLQQIGAPETGTNADIDAERREEMLDGLRELVALVEEHSLPVVTSQHRVIGSDVCHLIAPAALAGPESVPGKLFLTSHRLVFVTGRVSAYAWHRVRVVQRTGRDLSVVVAGAEEPLRLQCNSYGDALVAAHLIRRLSNNGNAHTG